MNVKKLLFIPTLFLLILTASNRALALDEVHSNQVAVSAGYFMPKENTLQGGWSVSLRYIAVETGKAQLSAGAFLSSLSLKVAKKSVQHRDFFINYTMQLGPIETKRKVTPFLGAGIDYVEVPDSGYTPDDGAGFNLHTGFRFGDHATFEGRYLFSRKANMHRGGWGVSLMYRF